MRKHLVSFSALAMVGAGTMAAADPAAFLGGTIRFGGGTEPAFGLTAKIISDDKRDEAVAGLGVSWFPGQPDAFGFDASVGYLFTDTAAMVGYDFVQRGAVFSLGYVDSKDDDDNTPAVIEEPPVDGSTETLQ